MPDPIGNTNDQKLLAVSEKQALLEAPAEERLQSEIDALRRELARLRERDGKKHSEKPKRPRAHTPADRGSGSRRTGSGVLCGVAAPRPRPRDRLHRSSSGGHRGSCEERA